MDKTFDPTKIEKKWAQHWEERGLFRPNRPQAKPYTIVNPPPNVTGALHIGHALDNTLQDVMIRYHRLRGFDTLWVVGTDHAGIATQMLFERTLAENYTGERVGEKKVTIDGNETIRKTIYGLTRDEFVESMMKWKEESGGTITQQLRRLGCSMDWENERFTLDKGFAKAVARAFKKLHDDGLVRQEKRMVNWDVRLETAISDLEVETRDVEGKLWYFRYPLADGAKSADGKPYIIIATTRPETMLADVAVAVHPDDKRYNHLVGKHVRLPITNRLVPIITDSIVDMELGSGAVKITPAHDFTDYEIAQRADEIDLDNVPKAIQFDGTIETYDIDFGDEENLLTREERGERYVKLLKEHRLASRDRFEARERIVEILDEQELIEKIEKRIIPTPFGDRSGTVIEPRLTHQQWFVDMKKLAEFAIEAVRDGQIKVVPKGWEKTWYQWLENIQPWCISRNLWWGHRIPVWYGPERVPVAPPFHSFCAENEEAMLEKARAHYKQHTRVEHIRIVDSQDEAFSQYGSRVEDVRIHSKISPYTGKEGLVTSLLNRSTGKSAYVLYQDEFVLDTWFSSALWPFATLGWPEETERLKRHYPNDLLISGFDILFFWDARMVMMGLYLMKDIPWKDLYLHGLVRAPDGAKMSKSKGNVVDPIGLIDKYGADALRFFMCAMESQGRDIKMDEARLAGYRNFATKLWNAARFCEANDIPASASPEPPLAEHPVNRWIIGEVAKVTAALDRHLADYRFDEAANAILHFTRDSFCDWYIELIKGAVDSESRAVAGWAFDQILVLLHPFVPFITEELWEARAHGKRENELIIAQWPVAKDIPIDKSASAGAAAEINWLIAVVSEARATRTALNLAPGMHMAAYFPAALQSRAERLESALARVGRLSVSFDTPPEGAAARLVVEGEVITLPLAGLIDLDAEQARLNKALAAAEKACADLAKRLDNPQFIERAKPQAIDKARADFQAKSTEVEQLKAALSYIAD